MNPLLLTNADFILIGISVMVAGIYGLLGADKLFKFYFGIIIGFLLFLVFNSEVGLVTILRTGPMPLNSWQDFLAKNGAFVLGFFTCMIPIFGLFFSLNKDIHLSIKKSFIQSILFGMMLPLFLVGIFVYAMKNAVIPLQFLTDILSLLDGSFFKTFFEVNPQLVFFFLLFILFYKMIFGFLFAAASAVFLAIVNAIKKSKGEDVIEAPAHDDSHEDDHSDDHHSHH